MDKSFSPQEIIGVAINVEKNGKDLYERLEFQERDNKLKNIWAYLKEQEEVHRKDFQKMLDHLKDYVLYEFNSGEYEAYLRAISSLYIFTNERIKEKLQEGFKSELESIDFALGVEKESIITYSELKPYILLERQPVLDKIIDEEKKHLVQLVSIRNNLR